MRVSPRFRAVLQALLVTFLWSTSWVLIKFALPEIPPLTFAGLRYTLAFVILLPGLWQHRAALPTLSGRDWGRLTVLGVVFYTLTQGGQFLTLNHLEATTFSLLLNCTAVLVALAGIITLREIPTRGQWAGMMLFLVGVLVYFQPLFLPVGQILGLVFATITVCANAAASVLGRSVNRTSLIPPVVVTGLSMGLGALVLLGTGLAVQGLPPLSWRSWAIVAWLAVVNTALAFTLWNITLRTLTAVESSLINNTMLVQIAILAWLFLGEALSWPKILGLFLATAGILMVQLVGPRVKKGAG